MPERSVENRIAELLQELTPEEAERKVSWSELIGAIAACEAKRLEFDDELDKARIESMSKIFDTLIGRLNRERYERKRFERFILTLLCTVLNLDENAVDKEWVRYQNAFDELNLKEKEETDG